MRIIPVMDLKDGQVVHGIAGRRQEYRPIQSVLTPSTRPVEVARTFRDKLGLGECYIADLDAIAGSAPALSLYAEIRTLGLRLWVDAGVHELRDAVRLAGAGVDTVIVGLETVSGPDAVSAICAQLGSQRVLFSLDLKGGAPLGCVSSWPETAPSAIAIEAIKRGVRRLLVLDLARVGRSEGTGTEQLCKELHKQYPGVELIAGGGVRNEDDLRGLKSAGIAAVLVASSLHNGSLQPEHWTGL